mgnify:CR=1 FL=1
MPPSGFLVNEERIHAAMAMKWTVEKIRGLKKSGERFACLTAYDAGTARLADEAGIPLILVGDSLGMTVLGYETTLPVTMDQMIHHTAAAARGVRSALLVGDMPFMSFQVSVEQGLTNAGRFLKEGGADAVKIEGGTFRSELIAALVANGIPVLGHIGLTPQSIREMGGYRVQGKTPEAVERLIADARAVAAAGAFALVVECVPPHVGKAITQAVEIPTIGIGAGPHCDGQILVWHDCLGLTPVERLPKFARRFADLEGEIRRALGVYQQAVRSGEFPDITNCYSNPT